VPDETILQEAQRLVHGDRGQDYGHPIEDFTRTGRIMGAILGIPDVPPEKVALCMIAVKISREVNRDKRDNRVDMAGYAETLDMVRQRQRELAYDPQEDPDRVPPHTEAPWCRFPQWGGDIDPWWVCCHGGSNCGACHGRPWDCKPHG
jgi:hypothetical protein